MFPRSPIVAVLVGLVALLVLSAPAAAAPGEGEHDDGDAVVVISGDVTIERGETVDGVYVAAGDVRIDGSVDGDVAVLSGELVVAGTVDGDVFVASGPSRLLPSAEVTGDVNYADERPAVSGDARVHGDVQREGWPDVGGVVPWVGAFLFWLAITVSAAILGCLLLLLAPRAADALHERSRERIGPLIAIGIAIFIVLPIAALLAAVTILGLPLALALGLALLPIFAVAYVAAAWALGRAIVKPPRERFLAFLAGLAILRAAALVPLLGFFVGLGAVIFGLGLIGAAIGAARSPSGPDPAAQSPGS